MWLNPIGIQAWVELAAFVGILAIGASLLMIAGEFDLSMGANIALAGHSFCYFSFIWSASRVGDYINLFGTRLFRIYYWNNCCQNWTS